ncbi:hypothetical protein C8R46DRAFT_202098 [Mycena filopes]|nr:hypothetical protein C8R46DRAFT_202098 [Mycena filopes]
MPPTDAEGNPLQLNLPPVPSPADAVSLSVSEPPSQGEPSLQGGPAQKSPQCRTLVVYTRAQMLHLQGSPLVKTPGDMPELKLWFGDYELNLNKKDSEPTTPNSARERRFRRDAEDGETSTRPTFRSTLSQPSQMGNFKHQSLRDRDRDRDRDGDKDRERDIRDKEGQERLRNLSDKYDRDRLAAPGLRNKERDIAPHLAVDAALRGSVPLSAAARRAEARDGTKKKVGEVSEDWRRGSHVGRQERYENSRTGREERPRDRDSSRSRRDVSTSRRDRDGDEKESLGDRKPARDDRRTREDHRRERDERRERERDPDRDADKDDVEDSRRWRDDGKRDERMAARRQGANDKGSQENGDASGDKRWTVVEDRDGRSKRNHRDRRAGGLAEDGKDREDRRDRDREREKEPAWMDTYIPDSPGILGSKGGEGELDGIQAWKKGLKEKEKEKEKTATVPPPQKEERGPSESNPMDEIQIFRMLMKQAENKPVEQPPTEVISAPPGIRAKASQGPSTAKPSESTVAVPELISSAPALPTAQRAVTPTPIAAPTPPASSTTNNATSLLSILGKAPSPLTNPAPPVDAPTSSRFFPRPINQQNTAPPAEKPDPPPQPPQPPAQFNPPPGSRLLAFGARPAGKSPGLPPPPNGLHTANQQDSSSQHTSNAGPLDLTLNHGPPKSDNLRAGFSPFEDQSRMSFAFEEQRERDQGAFSGAEPMRRGDRVPYGLPGEPSAYVDSAFDPSSTGYPAGKGSRLAKFFDSKGREGQGNQNPAGFTSPSSNPGPRHEGGYNPMDGLLSKLNHSAQIQRPNMMSPNSVSSVGGGPFGQQSQNNLQQILQQQQQQHNQPQHLHIHPNNRLDSLYESRLDDRNFVPDGMVPGLRSVPPPRARDTGLYPDSIEDSIHFNPQRLPPQHHRGLDPMYNPVPSVFGGGRNAGIPIQPQYRGAPSPISNPQQQRLPPGLANLGGRPPLEGSQFMGMPGLPSAGLHSGLHNGPPQQQQQQQQQFNNFAVNGNLNYGGPQMRVPTSSAHQIQGGLQHHQLSNLGHPNIDLRAANQAQLLNLGGRGIGMGGFNPQQGPPSQMQQQPLHALRQQEQQRQQQLHQQQQQQQQLPPHMMSHHHIQVGHPHQQQGLAQPNNNPPDLMALLMGGTAHHRD